MESNQKDNPKSFIAHALADFFRDEPHKITLWLLCKNPMFGNISPAELIAIRGPEGLEKVSKFISGAMELGATRYEVSEVEKVKEKAKSLGNAIRGCMDLISMSDMKHASPVLVKGIIQGINKNLEDIQSW